MLCNFNILKFYLRCCICVQKICCSLGFFLLNVKIQCMTKNLINSQIRRWFLWSKHYDLMTNINIMILTWKVHLHIFFHLFHHTPINFSNPNFCVERNLYFLKELYNFSLHYQDFLIFVYNKDIHRQDILKLIFVAKLGFMYLIKIIINSIWNNLYI